MHLLDKEICQSCVDEAERKVEEANRECVWCGTTHSGNGEYCSPKCSRFGWYYTKGDGRKRLKSGEGPMIDRIIKGKLPKEDVSKIKEPENSTKHRKTTALVHKHVRLSVKNRREYREKIAEVPLAEIEEIVESNIAEKYKVYLIRKIVSGEKI